MAFVIVGVASPILVAMLTVFYNVRVEGTQSTNSRVIAIKVLGFLYTTHWVVYNFCTPNGLPIHFQCWVANIQILKTSHYQLFIFRR